MTGMADSTISTELSDRILTITLDRQQLNACTVPVRREVCATFDQTDAEPEVLDSSVAAACSHSTRRSALRLVEHWKSEHARRLVAGSPGPSHWGCRSEPRRDRTRLV